MHGSRFLACLIAASLTVAMSSCVSSDNPLSDPDTAVADPDLYGVWLSKDEQSDTQILVVGRPGRFQDREASFAVKDVPAGIMRYTEIDVSRDLAINGGLESLDFFVTKVGKDRYLNVMVPDEDPWPDREWSKRRLLGYSLGKYQVSGDKLTVWDGDEAALTREVKSGKLKGEIGLPEAYPGVTLKETTAKMVKYLEDGGGAVLFPESKKKEFVRMRPVGKTRPANK